MILVNCSYLACCDGLFVCLMLVSVLFICHCCGQHFLLVGHLLCNCRSHLGKCCCEGVFNCVNKCLCSVFDRINNCLCNGVILRFIIRFVVIVINVVIVIVVTFQSYCFGRGCPGECLLRLLRCQFCCCCNNRCWGGSVLLCVFF